MPASFALLTSCRGAVRCALLSVALYGCSGLVTRQRQCSTGGAARIETEVVVVDWGFGRTQPGQKASDTSRHLRGLAAQEGQHRQYAAVIGFGGSKAEFAEDITDVLFHGAVADH